MEKQFYVIGMGELLWDMLPGGKQLGGAPANFAYHAQQLGAKGAIVSAIGNDELGYEIASCIDDLKIQSLVSQVDYPTGTVKVTLRNNGIPSYEICENVAWDFIPYSKETKEAVQKADAICFGSLAQRSPMSRNTIMSVLDDAPKDCLKVCDINLRQHFYSKEVIEASLNACNVLKINDEELSELASMFNWEGNDNEICRFIVEEYELEMMALTCGENGSWLFSKDEVSFLDTPKVNVADTVGAGDSFTGSIITGKLKGMPLKGLHEMAVNVSAFVCTKKGATPFYEIDRICDKTNC